MSQYDQCPCCYNHNLGQNAFDLSLGAGDEISCPECGTEFEIGVYDNGMESFFIFSEICKDDDE